MIAVKEESAERGMFYGVRAIAVKDFRGARRSRRRDLRVTLHHGSKLQFEHFLNQNNRQIFILAFYKSLCWLRIINTITLGTQFGGFVEMWAKRNCSKIKLVGNLLTCCRLFLKIKCPELSLTFFSATAKTT